GGLPDPAVCRGARGRGRAARSPRGALARRRRRRAGPDRGGHRQRARPRHREAPPGAAVHAGAGEAGEGLSAGGRAATRRNDRRPSAAVRRTTAMNRTMTIERVSAFNGLDVLVARDEGLFEAEGLDLRIVALPPDEVRSAAEGTFLKPVSNQGKLTNRGQAA